jgi:DNA-binding FadR family transcriptional regulator
MRSLTKTPASVSLSDRERSSDAPAALSSYVHQRIADEIGSAILCGRRAVGSLLPKEMDASADFGVSRTAYREAVRMLAAKGLVESRPKVGTHVTDRRRWQVLDPDVLRWAFHSGPSPTFIQELFELRGILEPHAAELAARRRSIEQLSLMGHALQEMAHHGLGTPQGRAADQRFHEEILVATGNFGIIELVKDRKTKEPMAPWNGSSPEMISLKKYCLDHGLFLYTHWHTVLIIPPLIITEVHLKEGFDVLDKALEITDKAAG